MPVSPAVQPSVAPLRRPPAGGKALVSPISLRKSEVPISCQGRPTHLSFSGFSIFGGIMKRIHAGAAALPSLTIDPPRNEEQPRSFQPTYHPETAASPQFMKPASAFQSDAAKKYLHIAAFILATLPLIACAVLTAMVIR